MIGFIKGVTIYCGESEVIVDCGGVGYRVEVGTKELTIPEGEEVEFFIYTHVRENEISLFGFETQGELSLFEKLLDVNGVGPKGALTLVSHLGVKQIKDSIIMKDHKGLKVPGIGVKTGKKIVLELHDKLEKEGYKPTKKGAKITEDVKEKLDEAREALKSLGYSLRSINKAITQLRSKQKKLSEMQTQEIVKLLLSKI